MLLTLNNKTLHLPYTLPYPNSVIVGATVATTSDHFLLSSKKFKKNIMKIWDWIPWPDTITTQPLFPGHFMPHCRQKWKPFNKWILPFSGFPPLLINAQLTNINKCKAVCYIQFKETDSYATSAWTTKSCVIKWVKSWKPFVVAGLLRVMIMSESTREEANECLMTSLFLELHYNDNLSSGALYSHIMAEVLITLPLTSAALTLRWNCKQFGFCFWKQSGK